MNSDKTANKGSIVIMVLVVMIALVAIVHSMLRSSSYLTLLAQKREIYERQYQVNAKSL
jgi:hypothetical protein